jgi:hypothetical protein
MYLKYIKILDRLDILKVSIEIKKIEVVVKEIYLMQKYLKGKGNSSTRS